jgi:hypothetical protein
MSQSVAHASPNPEYDRASVGIGLDHGRSQPAINSISLGKQKLTRHPPNFDSFRIVPARETRQIRKSVTQITDAVALSLYA